MRHKLFAWFAAVCVLLPTLSIAQTSDETADRAVFLDKGVVRWRDSGKEVALFGANYCVMSGSDYRMAGRVSQDRKAMIDEDLAHFARMGFTGLRLCSWGDWENSDREGNLVVNEHVDLLDYLIAKARERGIYLLLTPIHTYNPAFADEVNQPTTNVGFSRYFDRAVMGTDPRSIAAQANYIRQLLRHVNPYTHLALKDEPAILFIEMINEPVHHPEDKAGSVDYINTLVKAVRDSGCRKLTFFNVSQDFAIAPALRESQVDGVSFGWYPTSLVAGHTLKGNFLPAVDQYPDMLRTDLKSKPRIVYEFDQADLLSGTLYPAMARTFRSVGAQFAAMFAYDMLKTAPFNLGWQTHYLNLVHTPKKAMSAVIAAEAMRRLPHGESYGRYPDNTRFGDFRVSYENDSSELNADDAYINAGPSGTAPKKPGALRRVAGVGSSPLVEYEGSGAYFLDQISPGLWRLEVYPDQVQVRDPFEQPQPGKVVSRLLYRRWPMSVHLPDLGEAFFVRAASEPQAEPASARGATFNVAPGVWLLSKTASLPRPLPERVARVGLAEFHVNERVSYPDLALSTTPREFSSGAPVRVQVRIADNELPDAVTLWWREAGRRDFEKPLPMRRGSGNDFIAALPGSMHPGLYQYAVSVRSGDAVVSFPGSQPESPNEWPYKAEGLWEFSVQAADTGIRLLNPKADFALLSFLRPGEQYRSALFHLIPGESSDESALSLLVPDLGADTPPRYAAALYVGDTVAARSTDLRRPALLQVKLRAVDGTQKHLQVSLIERDGTAWSTDLKAHRDWGVVSIPLSELKLTRSIHIPTPYPGLWNYWRDSAVGRGGSGDGVRAAEIERLQLTVMPNASGTGDDAAGVAVEAVNLAFSSAH
jgi:hypothetical protein